MNELEYVRGVLGILAEAELVWQDTPILWHVAKARDVKFSMACSDTFYWGSADCEPIEKEDVAILRACLADLKAADPVFGHIWLPLLYCCRKRVMRPMNRYMEMERGEMPEAVVKLIEAAGPERESVFGAP